MRVGDASERLHPDATVLFLVLGCSTAMDEVEEMLGRFEYALDESVVVDGWIGASVRRRAGFVHVTEALRDLYERGAIRARGEN